jgi:hypothetical protein
MACCNKMVRSAEAHFTTLVLHFKVNIGARKCSGAQRSGLPNKYLTRPYNNYTILLCQTKIEHCKKVYSTGPRGHNFKLRIFCNKANLIILQLQVPFYNFVLIVFVTFKVQFNKDFYKSNPTCAH